MQCAMCVHSGRRSARSEQAGALAQAVQAIRWTLACSSSYVIATINNSTRMRPSQACSRQAAGTGRTAAAPCMRS
eukprot:COSAG01_NODE_36_length_34092_cov_26.350032_16_plen_75_part_00